MNSILSLFEGTNDGLIANSADEQVILDAYRKWEQCSNQSEKEQEQNNLILQAEENQDALLSLLLANAKVKYGFPSRMIVMIEIRSVTLRNRLWEPFFIQLYNHKEAFNGGDQFVLDWHLARFETLDS